MSSYMSLNSYDLRSSPYRKGYVGELLGSSSMFIGCLTAVAIYCGFASPEPGDRFFCWLFPSVLISAGK